MQHLYRRITVPALAAGVLALSALGTAHAAGPTDAASPAAAAASSDPSSPTSSDPSDPTSSDPSDPTSSDPSDPTSSDPSSPTPTVPAGLTCNNAPVTIAADHDGQVINGTASGDVISANGFHHLTINGGAGNDTICAANDAAGTNSGTTLDGGAGDDTLLSFGGRDTLVGGAGNDKLSGTINNDVTYGHDGYTAGVHGVTVNLSANTVTGVQSGTDTLTGLDQARFFGTAGNDTFVGDDTNNWFDGGAGADDIHGYDGNDWFHAVDPSYMGGNAGNDTLSVGYGGNVSGGKGDDTIVADPNNQISGASADAGSAVTGYKLQGHTGDDTFKVNTLKTGTSTWSTNPAFAWKGSIGGGKGDDKIDFSWLGDQAGLHAFVSSGTARWAHGSLTFTSEKIVGTPGHDVLKGSSDADTLFGGDGNDTIRGKAGNDNLHGNQGDDLIFGGHGTDKVVGGKNSDTCKSAEKAKGCEN